MSLDVDLLHGPLGERAGVFGVEDLDGLESFYRRYGYAVLAGAVDDRVMAALEAQCVDAQNRLVAGDLGEEYGTVDLIEGDAGEKVKRFANYVLKITELSPTTDDVVRGPQVVSVIHRLLGSDVWAEARNRFGFVYQDARSSADSSYKRIGWHSDWQSSPHLPMWPATAVTLHIDGTSPDNGFLRVVPGSHLWATPAPYENVNGALVPEGSAASGGYTDTLPPVPMPLRFEKVPGEVALYAEPGDILFHDCYLWHSAAIATSGESRRRHVRGSWYAGEKPAEFGAGDFVKNAAR